MTIYTERGNLVTIAIELLDFQRDPLGALAAGEGRSVAVHDGDRISFYCVPTADYEAMLERLEDLELNAIADAREGQAVHRVSLDAL